MPKAISKKRNGAAGAAHGSSPYGRAGKSSARNNIFKMKTVRPNFDSLLASYWRITALQYITAI